MIQVPNHTQIPNVIIDEHMSKLSHAQFKVLMAICRKTIGWHKQSDYISISQIVELTGVSNKTVVGAINQLEKKGFIVTKKSNRSTTLITINYEVTSVVSTPTSVTITPPSVVSTPVTSVVSTHTKETIKENIYKYNNYVDLWNECNGTNLRITDTKRKQIRSRLKRFSESEIESAIRARGASDWIKNNNQGHNWNALFRNDDSLEKWLARASESQKDKDAWESQGFSPAGIL